MKLHFHKAHTEFYSKIQANSFNLCSWTCHYSLFSSKLFFLAKTILPLHHYVMPRLFIFWIHFLWKPKRLCPCEIIAPLILPFHLCLEKMTGYSARYYATTTRQLRSHIHVFLSYPFLPIKALHLGSWTRICCHGRLWSLAFPLSPK